MVSILDDMRAIADAYRSRHALPRESPMVLRCADWAIAGCLAEAVTDGRPGTREELDRFATALVGSPVTIKAWGEE